jgi:hypothetical protein
MKMVIDPWLVAGYIYIYYKWNKMETSWDYHREIKVLFVSMD